MQSLGCASEFAEQANDQHLAIGALMQRRQADSEAGKTTYAHIQRMSASRAVMTREEILPGSLRILRSSGFALLDQSALRATLACVPFNPPPETMDMTITLSFATQP